MTRKVIHRLSLNFLIILAAINGQYGCASINTKEIYRTPEATAELKSRLGNIGFVFAQFIPRAELQTSGGISPFPMDKRAGVATDTLRKRLQERRTGEALVAGILLAPVGAPSGSGGGANNLLKADPEKDLNEREAILKKNLQEMKIQESLTGWFLKAAREKTSFPFELIKGAGPSFEGEIPDYRSLKENGIDTIQEITVNQFGWVADGPFQPNLSLYMNLQIRLVSTMTNKEIFNKTYDYEGERRKFSEWMDPDGAFFIKEIQTCYRSLAEKIMKDIYLLDSFIQ